MLCCLITGIFKLQGEALQSLFTYRYVVYYRAKTVLLRKPEEEFSCKRSTVHQGLFPKHATVPLHTSFGQ